MSTNFKILKEMKKRLLASSACIDSLIGVPEGSERFNSLRWRSVSRKRRV